MIDIAVDPVNGLTRPGVSQSQGSDVSEISATTLPSEVSPPFSGGGSLPAPDPVSAIGPGASRDRFLGVDCVRFIAALWIVWVHTVQAPILRTTIPTIEIGRFGTRLFSILAAYFLVRHVMAKPAEGWPHFAWGRFRRIYLPFLAWSLIYLAVRPVNRLLTGNETSLSEFKWEFLWIGTTYHLWFLPHVLAAGLLAYPLARWALQTERRQTVAGAVFVLGWVIAFIPVPDALDPITKRGSFFAMLLYITPSFLWGIGMGLWRAHRVGPWVGRREARLLVFLLIACLVVSLAFPPESTVERGHRLYDGLIFRIRLLALGLAALAFARWHGPAAEFMARFGRLSMGVYLCHILFVEGLHSFSRAYHIPASPLTDAATFLISVPLSFLTSWLLIRSPRTAWLAR